MRDWRLELNRGDATTYLVGETTGQRGENVSEVAVWRRFLAQNKRLKVTVWPPFYDRNEYKSGSNCRFISPLNSLQKQKTDVTLSYKTTRPRIGSFFVDACKRFQCQRKRS
ncbi:hypothetical protein [Aeromonas jandaei]|uniref:hypothetical protein n=1 Tax=Aeromonas jandaei TaxID=650 RepID=UPI003BA159C2